MKAELPNYSDSIILYPLHFPVIPSAQTLFLSLTSQEMLEKSFISCRLATSDQNEAAALFTE